METGRGPFQTQPSPEATIFDNICRHPQTRAPAPRSAVRRLPQVLIGGPQGSVVSSPHYPPCHSCLVPTRLLRTPGNLQEKPAALVGGWLQCQRAEKRGCGGTHWLPRGRGTPSPRSRLAVLWRPGDSSRRQAPDATMQVQVPREGPLGRAGGCSQLWSRAWTHGGPQGFLTLGTWVCVCASTQQQE